MSNLSVNLANKLEMPDMSYINSLAQEKGFTLGPKFRTPPKVLQDLYSLYKAEFDDPGDFEPQKHIFPPEVVERELGQPMNATQRAYYDYTLEFLMSIPYADMIGFTPMDKALRTMMYLAYLSESTNPNSSKGNNAGDNVSIDSEEALSQALQEQAKALQDAAEGNGNTDGGSSGGDPHDTSPAITSCVRDVIDNVSHTVANIYGDKRPADVPINKKMLAAIRVKAYLEDSVGLDTALDETKKRSNMSNERKTLQMEDYDQVAKASMTDRALPTFNKKMATKELQIKEKVKPEEKKQILYMLLDDSGSMNCEHKQTYVRAVLLNRLESVNEGKSELRFALYESYPRDHQSATDLESSQKTVSENL